MINIQPFEPQFKYKRLSYIFGAFLNKFTLINQLNILQYFALKFFDSFTNDLTRKGVEEIRYFSSKFIRILSEFIFSF